MKKAFKAIALIISLCFIISAACFFISTATDEDFKSEFGMYKKYYAYTIPVSFFTIGLDYTQADAEEVEPLLQYANELLTCDISDKNVSTDESPLSRYYYTTTVSNSNFSLITVRLFGNYGLMWVRYNRSISSCWHIKKIDGQWTVYKIIEAP